MLEIMAHQCHSQLFGLPVLSHLSSTWGRAVRASVLDSLSPGRFVFLAAFLNPADFPRTRNTSPRQVTKVTNLHPPAR